MRGRDVTRARRAVATSPPDAPRRGDARLPSIDTPSLGYVRAMRPSACIGLPLAVGCASGARDLHLRPQELPSGQRDEAVMVAAAYDSDPQDAAVLYQLASQLARAGRTEDALEALRRMAALETGVDPRARGFESLV